MRNNCWEFKNCGREKLGINTEELGVCPAAQEKHLMGINGGRYAGRACWTVAGTFCKGVVQGTFAQKIHSCVACDFYQLVKDEEGDEYKTTGDIFLVK